MMTEYGTIQKTLRDTTLRMRKVGLMQVEVTSRSCNVVNAKCPHNFTRTGPSSEQHPRLGIIFLNGFARYVTRIYDFHSVNLGLDMLNSVCSSLTLIVMTRSLGFFGSGFPIVICAPDSSCKCNI